MMNVRGHIAVALVAASLSGCSVIKPRPEVKAFGLHFIDLLERGDSAALVATVDPGLTTSSMFSKLTEVGDSVRSLRRDSTWLVGWRANSTSNSYNASLTYSVRGSWTRADRSGRRAAKRRLSRVRGTH